jgi:hypothetical protein
MFVVAVVAAVAVASFVVVGLLLPSSWSVRRERTLRATPESIFPLIADFARGWTRWSPFGRAQDPTLELEFFGPGSGVGAGQRWKGKKLGVGSMVITRADPETGIVYELDAGGFRLTGTIALERHGGETLVRWTDEGDVGRNLFFRYLTKLLVERFVGKDLARGLANLESVLAAPEASVVA